MYALSGRKGQLKTHDENTINILVRLILREKKIRKNENKRFIKSIFEMDINFNFPCLKNTQITNHCLSRLRFFYVK